jgi:predicted GNAT family acetyltransferase
MAAEPDVTILENEEKRRFELTEEGEEAYLTFARDSDRIRFLHTFVPPSLEGRGIGGRLAKHGLEYAREHGLAVVPVCPFVRAYIERHPEYEELVK